MLQRYERVFSSDQGCGRGGRDDTDESVAHPNLLELLQHQKIDRMAK